MKAITFFTSVQAYKRTSVQAYKRTSVQAYKRTSVQALVSLFLLFSVSINAQLGLPIIGGQVQKAYDPQLEGLNDVSVTLASSGHTCSQLTKVHTIFNPLLPVNGAFNNALLNLPGVFYCEFPLSKTPTNYSTTLSRDFDWLNGVSTLDLITMQNHIIATQPFTAGWQHIAADVNLSGNVSTNDMVLIRKMLLGLATAPQLGLNSESWSFVNQGPMTSVLSGTFTSLGVQYYTGNPLTASGYPWSLLINGSHPQAQELGLILGTSQQVLYFEGIKMGHCNITSGGQPITFQSNNSENTVISNQSELRENTRLSISQSSVSRGQKVKLQVSINPSTQTLSAFQATIKFNSDLFKFISISNCEIKDFVAENIGLTNVENGEIRMLWLEGDNGSEKIESSKKLFTIVLEANDNIDNISEVIGLDNSIIPTEFINTQSLICDGNIKIERVDFEVGKKFQIFPTIFDNSLSISHHSDVDAYVDFEIININGQSVYSERLNSISGVNSYEIKNLSNLIKGTYCYILRGNSGQILEKGVVIK